MAKARKTTAGTKKTPANKSAIKSAKKPTNTPAAKKTNSKKTNSKKTMPAESPSPAASHDSQEKSPSPAGSIDPKEPSPAKSPSKHDDDNNSKDLDNTQQVSPPPQQQQHDDDDEEEQGLTAKQVMDLTDYINEKKTGPTPKVIQAIMEQLAVVMSKGGVEFYKLSITDTLVYKLLDKGGINYFVLKLETIYTTEGDDLFDDYGPSEIEIVDVISCDMTGGEPEYLANWRSARFPTLELPPGTFKPEDLNSGATVDPIIKWHQDEDEGKEVPAAIMAAKKAVDKAAAKAEAKAAKADAKASKAPKVKQEPTSAKVTPKKRGRPAAAGATSSAGPATGPAAAGNVNDLAEFIMAMKARGADNTDLGEMAEAMLAKKRREQQ